MVYDGFLNIFHGSNAVPVLGLTLHKLACSPFNLNGFLTRVLVLP